MLFYAQIALAALIAGTLDTVVGFGGGLLLLPILVLVAGGKDGVVLGALIGLGWNIPRIYLLREWIDRRIALLFTIGIVPGAIVGSLYLDAIDPVLLSRAIGIALILLGGYYVLRLYLDRPAPRKMKSWVYPVSGFLSALLAGMLGAGNGPLQSGALAASGLPGREIAATNGAIGGITAVTRLVGYGMQGMIHEGIWLTGAVGFAAAFAGAYLGVNLSRRAKNSTLELVIGIAIVLAGIRLVVG